MKNKTKLVLMATGLSCAVLGCLGSATYAWFTTKNNIGVNYTNLTVSTTSPNLSVDMTILNPSRSGSVNLSGIERNTEAFYFSDLSSQYGETFYKKSSTEESAYAVVDADELQGRVLQYGLKVKNLGMVNAMDLCVKATITCGNDAESQNLRSWVRTGIYECTDDTFETKIGDGFVRAYMYDKTVENANKFVKGTGEDDVGTYLGNTLVNYDTPIAAASVRLEGIRFYKISIWMEGTANADQDAAGGGHIAISTSFFLMDY